MRFLSSLIVFSAIFIYFVQASNEVQCEITEEEQWIDTGFVRLAPGQPSFNVYYVCGFKNNVVISDPDTKLANTRNENVTEIDSKELAGMEYLPADIAEAFPGLKKLDIHQSSLKALSKKSFHGLFKLGYIYLSNNKIVTIDEDTFDDLREINTISLEENKLTSLPSKVFSKLSTLDTLHLDNNQISSIDADIFKNNQKLALLFLNNNKFTTFAPETFSSQVLMRQIWLHDNQISSLNSEWFKNKAEMIDMRFENNKITEIPLDFLSSLPSLTQISFSNNPLTYVDFAIFDKNPNINKIVFNGIKLNRVLNIDVVDKLKNIWRVDFEINDDSCIIGNYHKGTLNKLKQEVKAYCKIE